MKKWIKAHLGNVKVAYALPLVAFSFISLHIALKSPNVNAESSQGIVSLVSIAEDGGLANDTTYPTVISDDGRFILLESYADNLVPGDTNGERDVFLRDRQNGITTRVSVNDAGEQAVSGWSGQSDMSADGRYIVFTSAASNLSPHPNNAPGVYLHDTHMGTTTLICKNSFNGRQCAFPRISADGNYIIYSTQPDFGDPAYQVFRMDRVTGIHILVSVTSGNIKGNNTSIKGDISADGRYVAFESIATNLTPNDINNQQDIFVRDIQTNTTLHVTKSTEGELSNGINEHPSISADGRFVAFESLATNLVANDANNSRDVFAHDMQTGQTKLVSRSMASGNAANGASQLPSINGNGQYIAFTSRANDLVANDTNGNNFDQFVYDMHSDQVVRVSVDNQGNQSPFGGHSGVIDSSGRYIALRSNNNLATGDFTLTHGNVYLHERIFDTTAPTVTGTPNRQPDSNIWYNADVTIDWTATDPEPSSGTPTQPPSTLASTEGQDVVYTSDPSCDPAGNCATGSLTLSVDKTAPVVSNLALSANPKAILETSELTVNASDSLSGVQELEYFIGEDPGQGDGADMFFDGTTATVTIGTDMPEGVYKYSVRALDNAGNWSDPVSVFLTVHDPSGGFVNAVKMFTPSLANGDVLPGLTEPNQATKVQFGAVVKYQNGSLQGTNNDFAMDFAVGNGCQSPNSNCTGINVDATSIDWLILSDGDTKGTFQGSADVKVDGTTTSNPYRVEVFNSGHASTPNYIVVKVFAPGADPNTATPIYKASGNITGNVNVQQL